MASTPLEDLPESHIFRQIYRQYRPQGADSWDADLRRPINMDAIIERLQTSEGQEETKQWIKTGRESKSRRLFLHQLCDCNLGGSEEDILHVDEEAGMSAIRLALEANPSSIRQVDGAGYLPLHNVCDRQRASRNIMSENWHKGTKKFIIFLLEKYPEGASVLTRSSKSALSYVLCSSTAREKSRYEIIMTLLEISPSTTKIPDRDGRYPLHVALHGHIKEENIIKKLIQLYPQALEKKCHDGYYGGVTPLQSLLRRVSSMGISDRTERIISLILSVCPFCAFIEDSFILKHSMYDLDPAGDALDYASVRYSTWLKGMSIDAVLSLALEEDEYQKAPCAGGYAEANEEYLYRSQTAGQDLYTRLVIPLEEDDLTYENRIESLERGFGLILKLGHLLDGTAPLRPLHMFCKGRRCRPWYLAIIDQIIKRYPNEAKKRDSENNLPLHLFLESSMIEKERAKMKGFIADDEEYFLAVQTMFDLIIDANPDAASEMNGDGLPPIHLAIQHCNRLKFEDILKPLLDLAPQTAFAQHVETRLHPFAQASIGCESNLDMTFILLRRDPSILATLGF